MTIISALVTLLFFGSIGLFIAKRFKKHHSVTALMIIIAFTVIAQSVGKGTILVGSNTFNIYLNHSLQSLGLGMIVGIIAEVLKAKSAKAHQETKAV